jgi:cell division septum initiation protein DivIVA
MPDKISNVQVAQLQKLASNTLRALSEENGTLRTQNADLLTKVAAFEKRARAEKIAATMESKGLNPEVSFEEKIAEILRRDNFDVLEEAVGLAAPQTKVAFVHEDGVEVESSGDASVDRAAQQFAAGLASLD